MSHQGVGKRFRFRGPWLAVGLAVVLAVASGIFLGLSSSNSGAGTPGVTADSIVLGSHEPMTGPAAPGYSEVAPAINAFFQYINGHGGVYGRRVVFSYRDDQYNPVRTLDVVRQLVTQDNVFAMDAGLGTAPHQAVAGFLNNSQIPDLFVQSGCTCWNDPKNLPDTYGFFPNYKIEGKILGQYVHQNFPAQKVGYIYQDDDLGQGGQEGFNQIIPASQVAARESYDTAYLATQGLVRQVAAAKAAGTQVLVMFSIPAATALALLAAAALNYHPTFVVNSVGDDPFTVGQLLTSYSAGKANIGLAEGVISDFYLPSVSDLANPWIRLFKQVHDQFEPSEPFDGTTVSGMALAYTTYQALHAAGPNLTRQTLLDALNTQGSTFHGPNLAPFGYSATNHNGMLGVQMGSITSGNLVLSGPVFVTDDQDAPVTAYGGPHPEPPTKF